jgi:Mn2+/Fe2+ NRAMP family transporter
VATATARRADTTPDVQGVAVGESRRPRFFGPGLVSAASDNDPTTVASLAVVGATTGYALCWLVVLLIPMLAVVQAMAAAVGGVCQTSLQGAIVRRFGMSWAIATLCAVVAVNLFTLVADVKAGSEAMALLTPIPANFFILPFVLGAGWLLVSHSYPRIERLLALLPLIFVCYVASAILARFDLRAFWHSLFAPHITLSMPYVSGAIALLGTTLTSYVYVWESVEVAERRPLPSSLRAFKLDAVFGMIVVGIIFLFIVLASATTLGRNHLPIATANDIAAALTPLGGPWAGTLFGVGLLGSAILVVPILASTSAYVMSHTFGWDGSLDAKVGTAKAFYGVILGSLAIAALVAFAPVSPIAVLFGASIAGGLATPLTLFFLVRVARDRHLMGRHRIGPLFAASAWAVTGIVTIAAAAFLFMEFHYA